MELVYQGLTIVLILTYGYVLNIYIPQRLHLAANLCFSVLFAIFLIVVGFSFDDIGLGVKNLFPEVIVLTALLTLLILLIIYARDHWFNKTKNKKSAKNDATIYKNIYETTVRIPLATAFSEELIFRGILFAILLEYNQTLTAILTSSLVFGLWHIIPAKSGWKLYIKNSKFNITETRYILANVAFTFFAGILFTILRLVSGSIYIPWLLHWFVNSTSYLAVDKRAK